MKPLNDGSKWLEIKPDVKYMPGEEAAKILERCGIAAVCKPRADHDDPEHPLHVGQSQLFQQRGSSQETVHESNVFNTFELALSEKQIPRFVGNVVS
jgi:hypothetical protein